MFRQQDPYSYVKFKTLYQNWKGNPTPIGVLAIEYKTYLYNDVQTLNEGSVTQPKNQQFILTCTQRISLRNLNGTIVGPIEVLKPGDDEVFQNYPAMFSTSMSIVAGPDETAPAAGVTFDLLEYSPQTVNTAVQQNTTAGSTTGVNTMNSSTTGNSYSQSSTYGVSVGVSASYGANAGTTATASAFYEHSATKTSEKSNSASQGTSSDQQNSTSDTMSIKDWGSYAWVDPAGSFPNWVFGQEFPWNSIECRFCDKEVTYDKNQDQHLMYISSSMAANLYDGVFLYPPSELSMYGLSFVMKSSWRVYVEHGVSTDITIKHPIYYYSASHCLEKVSGETEGDSVKYVPAVYMDATYAQLYVNSDDNSGDLVDPSMTLDLNVMGLDPIGINSATAIVGFIPNRFIPAPKPPAWSVAKGFRTLATTNDLMIDDTTTYPVDTNSGFTASQTSLTATWNAAQAFAYQLTLYFKVVDSVDEYTLYLKHWKTQATSVVLKFVINEDEDNTITKYVDALEAEGGESNVLSIALRDLDFASVDYHDYLQLGLNSIRVTMQPINGEWANCGYQIRAISIKKE